MECERAGWQPSANETVARLYAPDINTAMLAIRHLEEVKRTAHTHLLALRQQHCVGSSEHDEIGHLLLPGSMVRCPLDN